MNFWETNLTDRFDTFMALENCYRDVYKLLQLYARFDIGDSIYCTRFDVICKPMKQPFFLP